MSTRLERRETQTIVKHYILNQYIRDWGGIIINGVSRSAHAAAQRGSDFRLTLIYFDGFSYKGRYLPDKGSSSDYEIGSPFIGVKAIDELIKFSNSRNVPASGISVLVETDNHNYCDLKASLEAEGYGSRLNVDGPLSDLGPNQIGLYHADCTTLADQLEDLRSSNQGFMFALLDPWGPTGIPHHFVSRIVSSPRTDLMIYWPWYDHQKKTGLLISDHLQSGDIARLDNYDRMYGSNSWRDLVISASPDEDREQLLVDRYAQALQQMREGVVVKRLAMEFPQADRTIYYLFLTTDDPNGALKLNEVLDKAKSRQQALKVHRELESLVLRNQPTLFDLLPFDERITNSQERQIDTNLLAEEIRSQFNGQSPRVIDIKRALANSVVYAAEIDSALRLLRREGWVEFEDLSSRSDVKFK